MLQHLLLHGLGVSLTYFCRWGLGRLQRVSTTAPDEMHLASCGLSRVLGGTTNLQPGQCNSDSDPRRRAAGQWVMPGNGSGAAPSSGSQEPQHPPAAPPPACLCPEGAGLPLPYARPHVVSWGFRSWRWVGRLGAAPSFATYSLGELLFAEQGLVHLPFCALSESGWHARGLPSSSVHGPHQATRDPRSDRASGHPFRTHRASVAISTGMK